eukprot:06942.XXX_363090_363254_1 [CDS] Oithona nana genome sequencing.
MYCFDILLHLLVTTPYQHLPEHWFARCPTMKTLTHRHLYLLVCLPQIDFVPRDQ